MKFVFLSFFSCSRSPRRVMSSSGASKYLSSIEGTIVVDPFILHSTSCNEYTLYLISIDLHKHFAQHLNNCQDDNRLVEIGKLMVYIHDGKYKTIKYHAYAGRGYKLPRIYHTASNE